MDFVLDHVLILCEDRRLVVLLLDMWGRRVEAEVVLLGRVGEGDVLVRGGREGGEQFLRGVRHVLQLNGQSPAVLCVPECQVVEIVELVEGVGGIKVRLLYVQGKLLMRIEVLSLNSILPAFFQNLSVLRISQILGQRVNRGALVNANILLQLIQGIP